MPLSKDDRRFLQTVDRFKAYLLIIAALVLFFLLLTPTEEMRLATSVIGVALCALFWLTQRLLSYITLLDVELMRVVNIVKRWLPEAEQQKLSSEKR